MRVSKVLPISLPPAMLEETKRLARLENRTVSEYVREALRRYKRAREWEELNAYGRARAAARGIRPRDVNRLVHEYRQEQRIKRGVKQPRR